MGYIMGGSHKLEGLGNILAFKGFLSAKIASVNRWLDAGALRSLSHYSGLGSPLPRES